MNKEKLILELKFKVNQLISLNQELINKNIHNSKEIEKLNNEIINQKLLIKNIKEETEINQLVKLIGVSGETIDIKESIDKLITNIDNSINLLKIK